MYVSFILSTAVVMCTMIFAPFWFFAFLLLAYTSKHSGYGFIFLAVAVDAFYGNGSIAVPTFTIVTTGIIAVMTLVRPRLSWSYCSQN